MNNFISHIQLYYDFITDTDLNEHIYWNITIDTLIKKQMSDLLNQECAQNISIYNENKKYFDCEYTIRKDKLICSFGESHSMGLSADNVYCRLLYSKTKKFIIFDNDCIYEETRKRNAEEHSLIPASMKTIGKLCESGNPFAIELFDIIFKYYSQKNFFYNDIYQWLKKDGMFIVPLNFNELINYHNMKELFTTKYKTATTLRYNWNKHSINLSYLILKAHSYVTTDAYKKLLQIIEYSFKDTGVHSGNRYLFNVEYFLVSYLKGRCENIVNNEQEEKIIEDYVEMCFQTKTKVNINFTSIKKIKEAHNEISKKNYAKETPVVKIKKNTAYQKLRSLLPKEFEWIKTRKRLIEETNTQKHCVWSYADKINKDKCQIYSYVDKATNKRFTLEFVIRKGKYVCIQCVGFANAYDDTAKEVKSMVGKLLKSQNQ